MLLPWLLATVLAWVYAGAYEEQSGGTEGDLGRLGYVSAILQTSSSIVYIVFILGAFVCIGVVGRPQSHWSYLCLVLAIPVFFTVPITSGILILISALNNEPTTDRNIGITAMIFCFTSTLPCCCIIACALTCGTRGKGRRSRYPLPIAYIPVLGEWEQREDKSEIKKTQREFTDDYPSDSPPGPLPSYKAERLKLKNAKNEVKSHKNTSPKSLPYFRDIGHNESSKPSTASSAHRRASAGSLSTIREDTDQNASVDNQEVTEKELKGDKDNSHRKFSLTAFLNSRRKSSPSSVETQERRSADTHRRHSEPDFMVGATKDKGQTVTILKTPKPKNADKTVSKVHVLTDQRAVSANVH